MAVLTEVGLHLLAERADVERNGADGGDHHEDVDDDVENGILGEGQQDVVADVPRRVHEQQKEHDAHEGIDHGHRGHGVSDGERGLALALLLQVSLRVTPERQAHRVGQKEEDESERVNKQPEVPQKPGERGGVQVLGLEVPGGVDQAEDEEDDEAEHHGDHAHRGHADKQTRVLQEREDQHDDGEEGLHDQTIHPLRADLEGQLAHEVRHGNLVITQPKESHDGARGRAKQGNRQRGVENVISGIAHRLPLTRNPIANDKAQEGVLVVRVNLALSHLHGEGRLGASRFASLQENRS